MARTANSENSDHGFRQYLKEISSIPVLTAEEEMELGRRLQKGDRRAFEKLIESNLRFVIVVAKKYKKLGVSFHDLISEGNLGLIEAVQRFDPSKNVRFTSYAVFWIKDAIGNYIARASHIFRITPKAARRLYKTGRDLAKLRSTGLESLTTENAARMIGIQARDLNHAYQILGGTISLDQTFDETGDTMLSSTLEDTIVPPPEKEVIDAQMKRHLNHALQRLNKTEEKVLRLRFGLDDDEPRRLRDIGEILNLTRERIRQIESHALYKIRNSPEAHSLSSYLH